MKSAVATIVVALTLLGLSETAHTTAGAIHVQKERRRHVKVYLYHDPGEHIDLSAVRRYVSPASPARDAIEELLKGPTADEMSRGFASLAGADEFAIGSLRISGGTARINFVASRTWSGWPGDLAPVRFKTAVELTLKQFPNVRRVIVSLNGDPGFWDER